MSNSILLFDVDGPLTKARQRISDEMWHFLKSLKTKGIKLGVVGGSDFAKILEQLGGNREELFDTFEYVFCENGLVGFHGSTEFPAQGMINVSPIGRSCSQAEREEFVAYELNNPIRKNLVIALYEKFSSYGLTFSIGGQISVDIFPNGWDKTYCLQYLQPHFQTIHFFGDKTFKGGNDYEIYEHPATIGHTVLNSEETRQVIIQELNLL